QTRRAAGRPQEALEHDGLAEDAGCLAQRHRRGYLQDVAAETHLAVVVVGVPELVSQGAGVAEVACEVEHHARLPAWMDGGAEGPVTLAFAGWHVEPVLVESSLCEGRHLVSEGGEPLDYERLGFLPSVARGLGLWDRGEEVVPGELLLAEQARFGEQVTSQVVEALGAGGLHGVEAGFGDAVLEQAVLERSLPTAAPRQRFYLPLDAVHRRGERHGVAPQQRDFRLERTAPHVTVFRALQGA